MSAARLSICGDSGQGGGHYAAKHLRFYTAKKEDWKCGQTESQASLGNQRRTRLGRSEDGQFLCQLQKNNSRK